MEEFEGPFVLYLSSLDTNHSHNAHSFIMLTPWVLADWLSESLKNDFLSTVPEGRDKP
jgi:hypothetical protein